MIALHFVILVFLRVQLFCGFIIFLRLDSFHASFAVSERSDCFISVILVVSGVQRLLHFASFRLFCGFRGQRIASFRDQSENSISSQSTAIASFRLFCTECQRIVSFRSFLLFCGFSESTKRLLHFSGDQLENSGIAQLRPIPWSPCRIWTAE
jgi:hypothetical protein